MKMEEQIYTFDRADGYFTIVDCMINDMMENRVTTFRTNLIIWYDKFQIFVRMRSTRGNYTYIKYNRLPYYEHCVRIIKRLKGLKIDFIFS